MAGKAEYCVDQYQELVDQLAVGVEARLAKALFQLVAPVPPRQGFGQQVDKIQIHAQRFTDIANGAFRPVGDQGCRECGPVAAVTLVDVLNDFFPALVLEIHIDVGRFVAFLRDETFEQQMHARRVDFGDVQAVANRRVGRRPAALAKNALAAGELNDVLYR